MIYSKESSGREPGSDRLTGWPVWSLCQMAAVRARMRMALGYVEASPTGWFHKLG
jgi:hypothetical protein